MEKTPDNQINKAFTVCRRISVPSLFSKDGEQQIQEQLTKLDGILEIETDVIKKRLRIVYDSSKVGFNTIEMVLTDIGYPHSGGCWSRFKAAIYQYQDETAHANATSSGGACCSNPRGILSKRNK